MIELMLASGESAVVVETDGDRVTVLAPLASPPGSTLALRLGEAPIFIKVRGCRRVEPDAAGRYFRIEGRFVSLSRELREKLSGPPAG